MEGRKPAEKPIMAREPRTETPALLETPKARNAIMRSAVRDVKVALPVESSTVSIVERKPLMRSEPKTLSPVTTAANVEIKARKSLMRSEPKPLNATAVGADSEMIRKPLMRSEPKPTLPVIAGSAAAAGAAQVPAKDTTDNEQDTHPDMDVQTTHTFDSNQKRGYFGLYGPIFAAVMLLGAFAFQARELIGQVLDVPLAKDYFGSKKK